MEQKKLDEILRLHKMWLNGEEEGKFASLQGADLRDTNLRGANLRGANLDYSCWPLWCGSLDVKVDRRIAAQLAYHFCRLDCDDPDYIAARNAIIHFANEFHRVELRESGKITIATAYKEIMRLIKRVSGK